MNKRVSSLNREEASVKLRKFVAKKVYGYLEFNVDFHSDLSFLVGVNGSGKTTILRLIQALLTPSLRDLLAIPFVEVQVVYEDKDEKININANKSAEQLEISVSAISETLSLPVIDEDKLDYILSRPARSEELFEEYQLKHSDHSVFKYISKINAPVFLGLERTHKSTLESPGEYYYERERMLAKKARTGLRGRRIVKGSLAAGLMETQVLIQDAFGRLRHIENQYSERLRESILLSAIKYPDFSFLEGDLESILPNWIERKQILQRRDEIELALSNIGVSGEKIKGVLESYFKRLEGLFESMEQLKEKKGIPFEWLLNKAQIDRISDLIEIIDDHKSRVDKLFSPINKFIDSVNSFYLDTGKSLSIDTVGHLTIMRPDKELAPIEALSSGERQLLIIIAHLLFNEYSSRSNVFIIDEPELSLHLKWQERFVEKAIEISPNTQLVLATHSPEIVGGYENKSISI